MKFPSIPHNTGVFNKAEDLTNNTIEVKLITTDIKDRSQYLDDVYIAPDNIETIEMLLKKNKNLILQGAPGVGKTYVAKRLAYCIIGKEDEAHVKLVQFHQNYSYEDFVQGYRPTQNGFELKNGIFYSFCETARKDPDNKYFFIIDEINRGNLSKIFGELLMLIEKDYRGTKIALTYSEDGAATFMVPDNLYIIGMMNTADRSLAMIDYALRRRFSFYEMEPQFENEKFKEYIRKIKTPKIGDLIEAIKKLNEKIKNDPALGKGFCIGHSYLCGLDRNVSDTVLENIVKYEILPTLAEYWFDNAEKYKEEEENLYKALGISK